MSAYIDICNLPGTTVSDVVRGQGYFPVIAGLGGLECVVALRGGAGHIGLGGRLDAVSSKDGGASWESPVVIADSQRDDRNPALGMAPNGVLVLAYHWQGSYDADGKWMAENQKANTRLVYSGDGGKTWQDDKPLGFEPLDGNSPFGKIRCDKAGTLYMPIYGGAAPPNPVGCVRCGEATAPTYLLRSTDNGATWGEPILAGLGLNEADLLFLPGGDWLLAARSAEKSEQAIYTCRSGDEGKTWGDLQRVTNASEHPPDLTLLGDGQVLLNFGRRHAPYGVEGLVSQDGGKTWGERRLRFADGLPGFDIGYPSTLRLENGRLITVYYSAGSAAEPININEAVDVCCRAVCYDEGALLSAL